jgi:hypothetical protein
MIQKEILYCGVRAVLACDGRCDKAWGINGRPRLRFVASDDNFDDDYIFASDDSLGTAPGPGDTVGFSEGGDTKPSATRHNEPTMLNKWCARECERSALVPVGGAVRPRAMRSPVPNMRRRDA